MVISLCGMPVSSIQKASALQKHQNTPTSPMQTTFQKDAMLLLLNLKFSVIYWHIILLPYSNLHILNIYSSKHTISNFKLVSIHNLPWKWRYWIIQQTISSHYFPLWFSIIFITRSSPILSSFVHDFTYAKKSQTKVEQTSITLKSKQPGGEGRKIKRETLPLKNTERGEKSK